MKRCIHASFDTSMPEWLRKAMTGRFSKLKSNLIRKYGIALDRAQFLDQPTANSLPVYHLATDYGTGIYIPGVNDDETGSFNRRNRKFGSLAKSSLPDLAFETVYIDLDDPNNMVEKRERYQDPRYTYRYDPRGEYAGQFKRKPYLGHNEYGPEEWSTAGRTPGNESRARDKSGYKVPSPEERIADYYLKFPERITNKIDKLYDRMIEVKQELNNADFNKPVPRGNSDYYSKAYISYSRAVESYRQLLDLLDSDRRLKSKWRFGEDYNAKEFANAADSVKYYLNEVEELLGYEAEG